MAKFDKLTKMITEYGAFYTFQKIRKKILLKYVKGHTSYSAKINKEKREEQTNKIFEKKYLISIVIPLYNTPEIFLEELLDSIVNQTCKMWELCLVDASDDYESTSKIVDKYCKNDSRVKYIKVENEGISKNTNKGIEIATGDFIAFCDHDDVLHPSAIYHMIEKLQENDYDVIYTDEAMFSDKITKLVDVNRKPDFDKEMLTHLNYICHFTLIRKSLIEDVGLLRSQFDGSQDFDLLLRVSEKTKKIGHVNKVLYFWRVHPLSVAQSIDAKSSAVEAGKKAIEEHFERVGIEAAVEYSHDEMLYYNVEYVSRQQSFKLYLINEGRFSSEKPDISDDKWQQLAMHFLLDDVDIVAPRFEKSKKKSMRPGYLCRNRYSRKLSVIPNETKWIVCKDGLNEADIRKRLESGNGIIIEPRVVINI